MQSSVGHRPVNLILGTMEIEYHVWKVNLFSAIQFLRHFLRWDALCGGEIKDILVLRVNNDVLLIQQHANGRTAKYFDIVSLMLQTLEMTPLAICGCYASACNRHEIRVSTQDLGSKRCFFFSSCKPYNLVNLCRAIFIMQQVSCPGLVKYCKRAVCTISTSTGNTVEKSSGKNIATSKTRGQKPKLSWTMSDNLTCSLSCMQILAC